MQNIYLRNKKKSSKKILKWSLNSIHIKNYDISTCFYLYFWSRYGKLKCSEHFFAHKLFRILRVKIIITDFQGEQKLYNTVVPRKFTRWFTTFFFSVGFIFSLQFRMIVTTNICEKSIYFHVFRCYNDIIYHSKHTALVCPALGPQ